MTVIVAIETTKRGNSDEKPSQIHSYVLVSLSHVATCMQVMHKNIDILKTHNKLLNDEFQFL